MMQKPSSIRKEDWCISAIIALVFGAMTAFIFYYIISFGVGYDGLIVLLCLLTAPIGIVFGAWGLVVWRSFPAFIGIMLCLSPLAYFAVAL